MYQNGERVMAWVAKIDEIKSIPDADAIEAYRVGGWWVVDQKNHYKVGDLVVYCSIDSWIPHDLAPFLSKGQEPKEYNDVKGNRLRTVKLRGQISQGLLLPVDTVKDTQFITGYYWEDPAGYMVIVHEGDDVSKPLNIQKYEPPLPACLAGEARGLFPSMIPRTDQERVQGLEHEIETWKKEEMTFETSLKLDGASMTVYFNDGDFGVCSRNLNLRENEENTLWQIARKLMLEEKLSAYGNNIALQGELCGPNIQGNKENLTKANFFIFDIFDIDKQEYLTSDDRIALSKHLGIDHVPVYSTDVQLKQFGSISDILEFAKGKSLNSDIREGVVFKCIQNPNISFKAINNDWLIKFD